MSDYDYRRGSLPAQNTAEGILERLNGNTDSDHLAIIAKAIDVHVQQFWSALPECRREHVDSGRPFILPAAVTGTHVKIYPSQSA